MPGSGDAEAAAAKAMLCCTCGKNTTEEDSLLMVRTTGKKSGADCRRCKKCHTLKSRVNRIIESQGASVVDWTKISGETKAEFMAQNADKSGDHLLQKMQETIGEWTRKSSLVSFKATGEFFDESDLCKRYKDKPEQLASIKEHGRKYWDASRRVYLFEDVNYQSSTYDSHELGEEKKRKLENIYAERKLGAKKVRKVKEEEDAASAAGSKLPNPVKKKLTKLATTFGGLQMKLAGVISNAEEDTIKNFVPGWAVTNAKTNEAELSELCRQIDDVMRTQQGDGDTIIEKGSDAMAKGNDALNRLKLQVTEAEAYTSLGGA